MKPDRPGVFLRLIRMGALALLVVSSALSPADVRADLIPIEIDTDTLTGTDGPLTGTTGYIAFVFTPMDLTSAPAAVTISNLEVDGLAYYPASESSYGDVNGSLSDPSVAMVTLDNYNIATYANSYDLASLAYGDMGTGDTITFDLSFTGTGGSAVNSPTTLSVFLYDDEGNTVQTADTVNNQIVSSSIGPGTGGSPTIMTTVFQPTSVPEPSTLALSGVALLLAGAYRLVRAVASRRTVQPEVC